MEAVFVLVGDLYFAFIIFRFLVLVVVTACENLLPPEMLFVFEYFIYSSTTHILYTSISTVNTFFIRILCITYYMLSVRILTRCKPYKSSYFYCGKFSKITPKITYGWVLNK